MRKSKFKNIQKRLITFLLVASTVLGCFSMKASASEATDRTSAFIDMAKGNRELSSANGDITLTEEDLQFLGVYISNFFVPFGTELGRSGTSDDITTKSKEDIVTALQTNLDFDDVIAENLAETILGLSRASVNELKFCVSEKPYQEGGSLIELSNVSVNYINFFRIMMGKTDKVVGGFSNDETVSGERVYEELKKGADGKYHYGYFVYSKGGSNVPVFDASLFNEEITPSQIAFYNCLDSVKMEKGYGSNFFDFTSNESNNGDVFSELVNSDNISDDDVYRMSAYGTKLNIDCFGNLIAIGGNHQYIVVPGCMNPYNWIAVDSSGEETMGAGMAYNSINIPSMVMADSNRLIESMSSSDRKRSFYFASFLPDNNTGDIGSSIKSVLEHICGGGNFTVKVAGTSSLVYIVGDPSELSRINIGKLNDREISSEVRHIRNYIGDFNSRVADLKVKASDYENSSLNNISNLKKATIKTIDMVNGLGSIQNRGGFGVNAAMRMVRGSKEVMYSEGSTLGCFGNSDAATLVQKAEEGFKASNPSDKSYLDIKGGIISGIDYVSISTAELNTDSVVGTSDIHIFDNIVAIDNLGAWNYENGGNYNALNVVSYFDDSGNSLGWLSSVIDDSRFSSVFDDIKSGRLSISSNISQQTVVSLYITYVFASYYDNDIKSDTIGKMGWKLNKTGMPTIPDKPLTLSSEAKTDIMTESIRDWLYYLLHPTEGLDYFRVWASNKINSFLLGWHDDMVGTRGTGSINGTTKYRGFSGYVTTPELSDIPWTSSLLAKYNLAIPFILIVMLILMLISYVLGVLTLQKAFIGFIIFAICINLPSVFINNTVAISNKISSSLYGEKFTYWALVQHESYSQAIDEKASGSSYSNYLKELYSQNSKINPNQGDESIMLKWQAPKKMASLMLTNEDETKLNGTASKLISKALNNTYSGESYLDGESVYLYRSYIDIANSSRYIHRGLESSNIQPINQNITNTVMETWEESLKSAMANFNTKYEADRNLGYANLNGDGSISGMSDKILRVRLPMASSLVNEALAQKGNLNNLTLDDYVGINCDAFEFSIPMFNSTSESFQSLTTENFDASQYTNEDFSALASYGLMSENPYYYFSWYLYESGLSEETSSTTGFKNMILGQENAGFFYNTKGNGELKDFLDMRSLFTYTIPYLKQCNDLVNEWDDIYGIFIYEGVPFEEGHQNDSDIINDPELKNKYWHNLNVSRLYNMYSPWIDIMYGCSYAKPEKISYLGESYVVADPINPASYPEERPMVFSKSEMMDYGLKESQLTEVERKIIKCQEGVQERLFKLLNYHTFNDVVLNSAAAINCTFEFNETFSENSLWGSNKNIYPQTFELNDFSYDAFLRFILSNSTGDSMIVDSGDSFYENITTNSSMTTVIVMLILDILSMYVLPWTKVIFLIGIFIMCILLILVTACNVDTGQKFIPVLISSLVKPMLGFLAITVLMSLIVSWFMGEGNTAVTGSLGNSISFGDPVMAMLAMIVLNVTVLYVYFKILRGVFKNIKKFGKLASGFAISVLGAVGGSALLAAGAVNLAGKTARGASSGVAKGTGAVAKRAMYRSNPVTFVEKNGDSEIHESTTSRLKANKMKRKYRNNNTTRTTSDIERTTQQGLNNIRRTSKSNNKVERSRTNPSKKVSSSRKYKIRSKDK